MQKIAGKACREVAGVHAMGTSGSRAFGVIRERIPGSAGPSFGQGVGVEVGEAEAAIDLDIVVEYGVGIAELGRSIQRNVKQAVERMTGLRVVEVNIAVDDVYLPATTSSSSRRRPAGSHDLPAPRLPAGTRLSTGSTSMPSRRPSGPARACPAWTAAGTARSPRTCPAARSTASSSAAAGSGCRSGPRGEPRRPPAAVITAALAPLTGNRPVDVAIADIDDPPLTPDWGPGAAGPTRKGSE